MYVMRQGQKPKCWQWPLLQIGTLPIFSISAKCRSQWGLVTIVDELEEDEPIAPISQIKILPYKEKPDWELIAKYQISGGDKYKK